MYTGTGRIRFTAANEDGCTPIGRLEEVFELPVRSLVAEWPEIPGHVTGVSTSDSAPLLGAALREVVLWN